MPQLQIAPALLTSKLHPPRLTSQHVPRPRLIEQLRQHADCSLILVCAPAGSGKSTLLSEWLTGTDIPAAWVSLDESDNDPVTFVSYVLAAMRIIAPTVTFQTRDLLQAVPPAPLELLATSLSNDLEQISNDFLLVLDDYHALAEPQIDAILSQVIHHPPRAMHLAVASRTEPSWPLATLRARGQVIELRYADLQFTEAESAAFLRRALGDACDQDLVAVLHEESEGWAAGLKLMTLVAAGRDGAAARNWGDLGRGEDTSTDLFNEVLDRQPADIQDHLLRMAMLERYSASLCAAICWDDDEDVQAEMRARELLADLEQRNLFLVPLDARSEFYRFHHLFQRFLQEQLRQRASPERISTLHLRASAWFATHGLLEEALDHALAGGDAVSAADLVARRRHELYNREQFSRLTRLLRLLPSEVKEHNPELLLAEARIATMNWRFTEAEVFLDHAEAGLARTSLEASRAEAAAGELAVLRGILDLWQGNAQQLLTELQTAVRLLPRDSSHLRGLAHMGIAAAHWQLGEPSTAKAYLTELLSETSPQQPVYATLLQAQAFLQWVDGDLTNLLLSAQRLLNVSLELELPDQIGLAHYFLGIVHYARNELEAARQELGAAVSARFSMRLLWWSQAVGVMALTYHALGHDRDARQVLADAHDFLLKRHAMRILPNLGAFQADLDRQQGRLADATAWATRVEPGPLSWPLGVLEPRLAQARIFHLQEVEAGIDRAAMLIAELRTFCRRVPTRRFSMEIGALEALLADRQQGHDAALDILQNVVLEAEPEGWVRLFVDLGTPMERLLRQLVMRRVTRSTAARVLAAFPAQQRLPRQSELAEPLTQRELEILEFLKGRDTNREIAERLFIAPSTVKRHTLNIFRKLDVNDRRKAVTRAIELGLLAGA